MLFHIKWDREYDNYFLDGGAYDYEQEVLLFDGAMLKVESVAEIKEAVSYTHLTLPTILRV